MRSFPTTKWLYDWHFTLWDEYDTLHSWMHFNRDRNEWSDSSLEKADTAYQRWVRSVQRALSIWGTGQWLTHPSWTMRLSKSALGMKAQRRTRLARKLAPEEVRNGTYPRNCDCGSKGLAAWSKMRAPEEQSRNDNPPAA